MPRTTTIIVGQLWTIFDCNHCVHTARRCSSGLRTSY